MVLEYSGKVQDSIQAPKEVHYVLNTRSYCQFERIIFQKPLDKPNQSNMKLG